jgi:hypothetical protein
MSDEHIDVDSLGHKMQSRADKSVAVTVVLFPAVFKIVSVPFTV